MAGKEEVGALYAWGGTKSFAHIGKIREDVMGWKSISAQISLSKVFIPDTGGNVRACIYEICVQDRPGNPTCDFAVFPYENAPTSLYRVINPTSITFVVQADAGCFAWATYTVFFYQ